MQIAAGAKAHLNNLQDNTRELSSIAKEGSLGAEARIAKQHSLEMQLSQIAVVLLNSLIAFVSPFAKQNAQNPDSGLAAIEPGEPPLMRGLLFQPYYSLLS